MSAWLEISDQYQQQVQILGLHSTDLVAAAWYSFQKQQFPVLEIRNQRYGQLLAEIFPKIPPLRRWLTRGFTAHGLICIKEGTWLGRHRLIIHEIGHLLDKDHTWWPTLMHRSWAFRWFNRW